jgi:hypothetical protein
LRGFHQKLEEQRKGKQELQIQPQLGDLVIAEEKRLESFVGMRFPRLRKASKSGVKVYGGTYEEGVETGKTITFAEGLVDKSKSFGGLLPR